jgi:sugar phosphate permease
MMIVGFLADFILFIVPAFHYAYYTSKKGVHAFQAMYFLSSFFNQFGPNSVTFLVAAEVYPTPIRATAHGFSAAVGKLGALTAAILYNYIDTQTKFYVVPWFGLAGAILTFVFLPDTTGLDLKEQERRWTYIRAGRAEDYHVSFDLLPLSPLSSTFGCIPLTLFT